MILEKINLPDDVKKLKKEEKLILAEEIREEIKDVVSKNGGHLASNLGVVELTIALHSVFDMPKDKIVWDVGHQTYVHKILTGRKEELKNIKKQIESFKQAINNQTRKLEVMYDDRLAGIITLDEYMKNANRIKELVKGYEQNIKDLEQEISCESDKTKNDNRK